MSLTPAQADSIGRLYADMFTPLYLYAQSALSNAAIAEEAVQDTFRIACIKADDLLSSDNPQGWLINTLKNVIRNVRKHQSIMNSLVISSIPIDLLPIPSQKGIDQLDLEYGDLLGQEDFALLKMIVLEKRTILEAAQALDISVEACKKRIQRTKKRLKKKLEEI